MGCLLLEAEELGLLIFFWFCLKFQSCLIFPKSKRMILVWLLYSNGNALENFPLASILTTFAFLPLAPHLAPSPFQSDPDLF